MGEDEGLLDVVDPADEVPGVPGLHVPTTQFTFLKSLQLRNQRSMLNFDNIFLSVFVSF